MFCFPCRIWKILLEKIPTFLKRLLIGRLIQAVKNDFFVYRRWIKILLVGCSLFVLAPELGNDYVLRESQRRANPNWATVETHVRVMGQTSSSRPPATRVNPFLRLRGQ